MEEEWKLQHAGRFGFFGLNFWIYWLSKSSQSNLTCFEKLSNYWSAPKESTQKYFKDDVIAMDLRSWHWNFRDQGVPGNYGRTRWCYCSQSPTLRKYIEILSVQSWDGISTGSIICPGGGVLESNFAGYVPLASQNPYPIIVNSVASYRPHLSHFWANVIVISRTDLNANRLLNIKTTAGTIFQPRIFLFLNPCLPEFSYPKNPENLRPHSSNSTKNVTPL